MNEQKGLIAVGHPCLVLELQVANQLGVTQLLRCLDSGAEVASMAQPNWGSSAAFDNLSVELLSVLDRVCDVQSRACR